MTAIPVITQIQNRASNAAGFYEQLFNNVFNNLNGQTPAQVATDLGTQGALYFNFMSTALANVNAVNNALIPSNMQTYPNTVTINSDGTVTIS